MITLISSILKSILEFTAGFLFCKFYLTKCSDKKWQKFKDTVEKRRETGRD